MISVITVSNSSLRLAFLLLAIFLVIGTLQAATITVTNTDDDGAGSLREAVASAAPGDTIDFNLSGCPCAITLTTGQIFIDKSLTINGPGADALTVSGNNASRIFYILSGQTVNISGLTLANGNVTDIGGAIINSGTLTLTRSVVSNSTATDGLSKGGGIYNSNTLILNTSTVSNNSATDGGGIYSNFIMYATNSTISNNTAYYGYGGGIYLSNFTYLAKFYNCTLSGNTGLNYGAGIYKVFSYDTTHISVRNTIIAGNSGGFNYSDVYGDFYSEGYNLIGIADGSTGFTQPTDQKGTGGSPLNPLLGSLQNNGGTTPTQALLTGSPAIDKGGFQWDAVTFDPLNQDQRGTTRPFDFAAITNALSGNGADIGAFELQCDTCDTTPPVITPQVSGTLGNNGWYTSDIQISWSVVDNESAVTVLNGCDSFTIYDDTNDIYFPCTASSEGGVSGQTVGVRRDATAPVLAPTVSPNPVLLNGTATATPNASDALSGIASASCGAVDTSTVGSHSVACTATDNAGNSATVYASYQVVSSIFNFVGFFQPVDNLPTLNIATAGSSIPVKFSLGGYQGLAIFAAGYPASSQIQCDASEPGATIEETVNAGGSSLSYSAGADQYNYVWKTDKSWKGTCRMLVVKFTDGSQHFAKFRFR